MALPFTHDQFLDVFGRYNTALWPLAAILWLLSAALLAGLVARRDVSRPLSALLALHWLVSGVGYHLLYFNEINPAARLFGAAFVAQAVLFTWLGVTRPDLTFSFGRSPRQIAAAGLSAYALAYPLLAWLGGMHWPRLPLFAVPCPTTILTAGLLLAMPPGRFRGLSIIPVLWALVGGSAAWLLGVRADLMLFAAAALLVWNMVARRSTGLA